MVEREGPFAAGTGLLVSARDAAEALVALAGGADVIDLKEPREGALGAVAPAVLAEAVRAVAGRRLVSATTGDLPADAIDAIVAHARATAAAGVDYVKIGLFPGPVLPLIAALGRALPMNAAGRSAALRAPAQDKALASDGPSLSVSFSPRGRRCPGGADEGAATLSGDHSAPYPGGEGQELFGQEPIGQDPRGQEPLIRPSGPPSPLRGEGEAAHSSFNTPPLRTHPLHPPLEGEGRRAAPGWGDAPSRGAAVPARLVAVLFADAGYDPALFAPLADAGFAGVVIDTADKKAGRLLDHFDRPAIVAAIAAARRAGLFIGLAGSLRRADIAALAPLGPDLIGFRGAACDAADRTAGLAAEAVAGLAADLAATRARAA